MATNYLFKVNGHDFSQMVERDSYSTGLEKIYTDEIVTLNKRIHKALIGLRGSITVSMNPQTAEDTALLCQELMKHPLEVEYHCLQRDEDVFARMIADMPTAQHLSRCLYRGQKWQELDDITLEEL